MITDDKPPATTEANGQPSKANGTSWPKIARRIRVPLSFVFAIAYVWVAAPTALSLAVGMPITAVGLALRAAAAGHVRKDRELTTSGPYAYTRNPLYLGSFILGVGFTIASGQLLLAIPFAALFLGIYFPVMRVEARHLAESFGEDFDLYARAVPLFLPRLTPYKDEKTLGAKFDASLYLRYREYRAALGLLIAWCVLALKAVLVK